MANKLYANCMWVLPRADPASFRSPHPNHFLMGRAQHKDTLIYYAIPLKIGIDNATLFLVQSSACASFATCSFPVVVVRQVRRILYPRCSYLDLSRFIHYSLRESSRVPIDLLSFFSITSFPVPFRCPPFLFQISRALVAEAPCSDHS